MGGLHVTSLPDEAAQHADTIILGPAGNAWTTFLEEFRARRPQKRYVSTVRTMEGKPPIRRDLIKRERYLCPNSIVVSRGCPHTCDFCYKEAFYSGGRSFYTQLVDEALAEIERLPGKHVYFLDDHLLGNERFANALFDGMVGMGKVFQAASTVQAILKPGLLEKAAKAGMRSVFVGFETLDATNLKEHDKYQNLGRDYAAAIKKVHENGVMVNGSFVFGMDNDDESVFDRTVDWATSHGIETATFHIMTPYPSTELHRRMAAEGRMLHENWDLYDTRHVVYKPARLTPEALERGYWHAYKQFYTWHSLFKSASVKKDPFVRMRHLAYAGGWKKFEPMWDLLIRSRQVTRMLPMLEAVLAAFGRFHSPAAASETKAQEQEHQQQEQPLVLSQPVVQAAQKPTLRPVQQLAPAQSNEQRLLELSSEIGKRRSGGSL
jgi:radical SAM superfamily enzyme YgiQ (UPF0313 family)